MNKFITLLVGILFISSYSFSQYYYIPASTPGNPGGFNGDSEYPSGSGLDPTWTVILGPSQSTPVWSSTETIPFNFDKYHKVIILYIFKQPKSYYTNL